MPSSAIPLPASCSGPGTIHVVSHTVLVVGIEAPLRRILGGVLTARGYRVTEAGGAESAYGMLASEAPDAVLLDLHLPTISGLALYLVIVHHWPTLEGRVAIMTGDAETAEMRGWLDQHGGAVFRKAFCVEEVCNWLAALQRPAPKRKRGRA